MGYAQDRCWSDQFDHQVKDILRASASRWVKPFYDDEADRQRGSDVSLRLAAEAIAVRTRDATKPFRDLTIRSDRASGARTELEKIRAGDCPRVYLLAWGEHETTQIVEWVLIDIMKLRMSGLLEVERVPYHNDDGTSFVVITLDELKGADAVLEHVVRDGRCHALMDSLMLVQQAVAEAGRGNWESVHRLVVKARAFAPEDSRATFEGEHTFAWLASLAAQVEDRLVKAVGK